MRRMLGPLWAARVAAQRREEEMEEEMAEEEEAAALVARARGRRKTLTRMMGQVYAGVDGMEDEEDV